jgi:hypothetical protein
VCKASCGLLNCRVVSLVQSGGSLNKVAFSRDSLLSRYLLQRPDVTLLLIILETVRIVWYDFVTQVWSQFVIE